MSKMSLMPSRRSSGLLLHRTASKNGNTGFEDLKNFIKDGGDFAKEVAAILEERAELEAVYSKVKPEIHLHFKFKLKPMFKCSKVNFSGHLKACRQAVQGVKREFWDNLQCLALCRQ